MLKLVFNVAANPPSTRRITLVQQVGYPDDVIDFGGPIVAGDACGSGIGDTVVWAKSKEGAFALPQQNACCDAAITAIIDSLYTREGGEVTCS